MITTVNDDVSPVTGAVANSGSTNDTTPTLSGTAEANAVVDNFNQLSQTQQQDLLNFLRSL